MFVLQFLLNDRSILIRIREAQKHMDYGAGSAMLERTAMTDGFKGQL
jgi:hypothetical protein